MNCPFATKAQEGIGNEYDRHNQKKTENLSKFLARRAEHTNQHGADAEGGYNCAME